MHRNSINTTNLLSFKHLIVLLGACLGLWGWNYGLWRLWGADEGRYVQVAKELLTRSNWFLLTVHGEPYDQKPPLPFWLFAWMLKLNGGEVSSWAVRLPSVLLGVTSVLCVYGIARRLINPRAGMAAALVFLTCPLVVKQTPTARLDMLFTGWITATLCVYFTRIPSARMSAARTAFFWLFLNLAFFTKGPLCFLFVLPPILGECLRDRSWNPWRSLRPLIGVPITLALIAAWLFAQAGSVNAQFVWRQFVEQIFGRITTDNHSNPPWYYLTALFSSAFFPWIFLLIPALIALWRHRKSNIGPWLIPILFWAFIPLVVLSLGSGKRPHYLLPILPPLSVLVGWYVDGRLLRSNMKTWIPRLASMVGVLLGLCAAGGAGWILVNPDLLWEREFYVIERSIVIWIVTGALAAILSAFLWFIRRPALFCSAVMALILMCEAVLLGTAMPAMDPRRSTHRLSRRAEQLLSEMQPRIQTLGAPGRAGDPFLHVYGNYRVQGFDDNPKNLPPAEQLPNLLILRKSDVGRFSSKLTTGRFTPVYSMTADTDPYVFHRRGGPEPPTPPGRLIFAALGDMGTGDSHQRRVVERMDILNQTHPLDAVFLLGDNLYGDDPFPEAMQERFIEPFDPLLKKQIPFYAALGNHDVETEERRVGELTTPYFNMNGREYYRVDYGEAVTFFILNSESIQADPEQVLWLRDELANCRSVWKIMILHRPLVASDMSHGGSNWTYKILKEILEGTEAVDIVLAGHNHFYERRRLLDGIQHITVGSGGELAGDNIFPPDPHRIVGYNDSRCFSWMEIVGDQLHFQVIEEDGEIVDEFTLHDVEHPEGLRVTEKPETPRVIDKE